jgi:hypothetical protein
MRPLFNLPVMAMALAAVTPSFAASPPGLVSAVVAGTPDPDHKVPTFNGVPGAGVQNLDVADPQTVLVHGGIYTYCVAMQDVDFTGDATFSYKITQGTKTLEGATLKTNAAVTPGGVWAYCINGKSLPDSPGAAVLNGTVSFASSPKYTSKLKVPIIIQ